MHCANPQQFFLIYFFFVETEMDRQLQSTTTHLGMGIAKPRPCISSKFIFDQCQKKNAEITQKWSKNSNTARTKERAGDKKKKCDSSISKLISSHIYEPRKWKTTPQNDKNGSMEKQCLNWTLRPLLPQVIAESSLGVNGFSKILPKSTDLAVQHGGWTQAMRQSNITFPPESWVRPGFYARNSDGSQAPKSPSPLVLGQWPQQPTPWKDQSAALAHSGSKIPGGFHCSLEKPCLLLG